MGNSFFLKPFSKYSKDTETIKLYQYLTKSKKESEIAKLLYPALKDAPRMRKLSKLKHKLTRYIEEYMTIQAFRKDANFKPLYFIKFFHLEKDDQNREMFQKVYQRVEGKLVGGSTRHISYWKMRQYLIHELEHHHILHDPKHRIDFLSTRMLYSEIAISLERLHSQLHKSNIDIPSNLNIPQTNPYRFSDAFYEITYRFVQLQAQYEVNQIDSTNDEWLEAQIHSLRQYIRTKKGLSPKYKAPYLERLRIFRYLALKPSPQKLQELLKEIESVQSLSGRLWLQKKIIARLERR